MSAPIIPEAPGLFSTTTVWPRLSVIFCARMRPTMSTEPPGAKGAMSLMVFVG